MARRFSRFRIVIVSVESFWLLHSIQNIANLLDLKNRFYSGFLTSILYKPCCTKCSCQSNTRDRWIRDEVSQTRTGLSFRLPIRSWMASGSRVVETISCSSWKASQDHWPISSISTISYHAFLFTLFLTSTLEYAIPEGELNAGRRASATSRAFSLNSKLLPEFSF